MNRPNHHSASLHGWTQPQQDFGTEIYPGLGDPFAGPPALINPVAAPQLAPQTQKGGSSKSGILNNIGEWKQMLDRLGGIDGVLGYMGKIQKFASTMQQMAPLLRLFIGKGGGAAATAAGISRDGLPRRRRRNRRRTAPYSGSRRAKPRTAKKRR